MQAARARCHCATRQLEPRSVKLDGVHGFEPRFRASKTPVLPLDDTPTTGVLGRIPTCVFPLRRRAHYALCHEDLNWTPCGDSNPDSQLRRLLSCALNDRASNLADPAGLEPAISAFAGPRSVHLNYGSIWTARQDSNPHEPRSKRGAYPFGHGRSIWRARQESNLRAGGCSSLP